MNFDDIRPYSDKELPAVLKRIIGNKWVLEGIRTAYLSKFPKVFNKNIESLIYQFLKFKTSGIKTTDQFREKISLNILVKNLVRDTTDGINYTGLDHLD